MTTLTDHDRFANTQTPIDLVLSRVKAVKQSGDTGRQWVGCCPAHDDNNPSLSIKVEDDGKVLLHCFGEKGCSAEEIVRAIGLTMRDLFPPKDENGNGNGKHNGQPRSSITVEDLAFDKRLPAEWLEQCGVVDMPGTGVGIPYHDEEHHRVAFRKRTALRATDGSFWVTGDKPVAYGLWRLPAVRKAEKYLVIVEGESDCWTLWHHGFPAIGLPGADFSKVLTPEVLSGIERIYVWRELDEGGEKFIGGIGRQLQESKWNGEARMISDGPVKDPNALHQINPDQFKIEFQKILDASVELPKPSGKAKQKHSVTGQESISAQMKRESIQVPSPGYFDLNDQGNAERLEHRHGKDVHFVSDWDKWMIWRDGKWGRDRKREIYQLAASTAKAIYTEAQQAESAQLRDDTERHARHSASVNRIDAMIKLAKSLGTIAALPENFDRDSWLLNVSNGTVDLRSGELREHRREDLISKMAQVNFDANAKCSVWSEFLKRIMNDDQTLVDFLQLAVGYSLTGETNEKCFFFLHGDGDNGKSTFMEIVQNLLGDYWCKTPADALLAKSQQGGVPNDIARLAGMRMATASEMPEGRRLDEGKIKDLTGRDTITARFMRAEWFDFIPNFKLWMYGNHLPRIKNNDEGIWRRFRIIPFDVVIPKSAQDPKLPDKLRAELPGILNWAIEGCLRWQSEGLPMPRAIKEAVSEFRTDMDVLGQWIDDCCFVGNQYAERPAVLHNSYKGWCSLRGHRPMSPVAFGMRLKQKGFHRSQKTTAANRLWHGIGLSGPPATEKNQDADADYHLDELRLFDQ